MNGRKFRRGPRSHPSSGGFTVIEAAMAISLFSVVLIGAGGMIMTLAQRSAYSNARTRSALALQEQVERLHDVPFAQITNGFRIVPLSSASSLRVDWTVTAVVPGRLAQVDLTVKSTGAVPGGSERAVRIFLANRNP